VGDHPGESVIHDVGDGGNVTPLETGADGNDSVGAVGNESAAGAGGNVSVTLAVGGPGISEPGTAPGADGDSPGTDDDSSLDPGKTSNAVGASAGGGDKSD
jgi:hypothetical protein